MHEWSHDLVGLQKRVAASTRQALYIVFAVIDKLHSEDTDDDSNGERED